MTLSSILPQNALIHGLIFKSSGDTIQFPYYNQNFELLLWISLLYLILFIHLDQLI